MATDAARPSSLAQRWRLLHQIAAAAELPMTVLSVVWLVLLVIDLSAGLPRALELANYGIWAAFILHFALEFALAPGKSAYLRRNWITALALILPAFRLLRVLRFFRHLRLLRFARPLDLARTLLSLNRGMSVLRRTMARRGLGYVIALTVLVYFLGAAGMLAFEGVANGASDEAHTGFAGYAHALWWTAMIMFTMGTDYWPRTGEGRVLCSLLALYGFSMFGYVTATLATYFVGADRKKGDEASRPELERLRSELVELKRLLASHPPAPDAPKDPAL